MFLKFLGIPQKSQNINSFSLSHGNQVKVAKTGRYVKFTTENSDRKLELKRGLLAKWKMQTKLWAAGRKKWIEAANRIILLAWPKLQLQPLNSRLWPLLCLCASNFIVLLVPSLGSLYLPPQEDCCSHSVSFFFFTTAFFLSFNVRQVNCRKNFAKLLLLSPFIGGKFLKCLFQASAKLISAGSKLKTRPPASLVGNYGAKWLVKVRISLLKLFCPAEKRSKIQLQLSGYQ